MRNPTANPASSTAPLCVLQTAPLCGLQTTAVCVTANRQVTPAFALPGTHQSVGERNNKGGGSGRRQLLEQCADLWRSGKLKCKCMP